MKIVLNNRKKEITEKNELNVIELFEIMRFTFPNIVVKINGNLIQKQNYKTSLIRNGDKVDAIHMISGG
jgi:sulfur carrier protein